MKSVLWIVLLAALTLAIRGHNLRNTFIEGQLYFVDADCYSRMTRAQIVDDNPGTVVRWHEFENYPIGVLPHTTVPLDYLIVGLKGILGVVARYWDALRASVLARQLLDLAGALISPLLGVATVVFLSVWARWWIKAPEVALMLPSWFVSARGWLTLVSFPMRLVLSTSAVAVAPGFFFAVSPILVHGTLLGRPDHQSLVLLLVALGLGTEWMLVRRASGRLAVAAGLAWGLALWVSVYEPLVLLAGFVGLRWIERRISVLPAMLEAADEDRIEADASVVSVKKALTTIPEDSRSRWTPARIKWAVLLAVLVIALLIERWHFQLLNESLKQYFTRWASSIGELKHLDPRGPTLYRWLGLACVISPILLLLAARRDRRAISVLGMLLLTFGLTCWQIRWGYFLALVYAMSLPWQLAVLRWRWLAWPLLLLSLWPAWREWDEKLFPADPAEKQAALRRMELVQLRRVATAMRSENTQAFIAPWWLSPPLAYWSGQPGVAGSSHESLAGIVDTARFYTSTSPDEAAEILRKRQVAWVLAEDSGRVLSTSKAILGADVSPDALAYALADRPSAVPSFLVETPPTPAQSALGMEVSGPQFFRLYSVKQESLQP